MSDWVTVQPSLDPILAPVNAVIAAIDGVLSALLVILNIIQTILNIVKAFLLGLLDPLKAIIKAIIKEIRDIINDLRQLGFYLHIGDIRLADVKNNFKDLRGGFNAYERRMIARLTNRRDPTRPDFSSSSAALGFFIYVSSQDIDALIRVLTAFYKFLTGQNVSTAAALPQPTGLKVEYGSDGMARFKDLGRAFAQGSAPAKAMVKWSMPAGPGPGSGFKSPVPKGWVVEVSTVEGGMRVVGTAPLDRNSPGLFPAAVTAVGIDPVTNGVLSVYGASEIVGSDQEDYSDVWPSSPDDPRAIKWFFQRDINTPLLPPKALSRFNDGPWLGSAFYVPSPGGGSLPGQEFFAVFDASMMPKDADVVQDNSNKYGVSLTERTPPSYFVTVRAVSKEVKQALGNPGSPQSPHPLTNEQLRLIKFGADDVRAAVSGRLAPSEGVVVGASDFGTASQPLSITFPGESSLKYQEAIQLALIVMLLSRSDASAPESEDFARGCVLGTTGLEEIARKLNPVMKVRPNKFYDKEYLKFRGAVYRKTLAYAQQLYTAASLSEPLMAKVVEMAEPLFTMTWKDMAGGDAPAITIAQSFGMGNESAGGLTPDQIQKFPKYGVAPNASAVPFVNPNVDNDVTAYYGVAGGPARAPGFMEKVVSSASGSTPLKWYWENGSLDSTAPVVYNMTESRNDVIFVGYARNIFFAKPEVIEAAASVLKVTAAVRSPRDGGWYAVRPLYEMLAPLDQILTNVEAWLLALLGALDGIIERIVAFIEAIQARIYQLQALIEWIRSLLRSLDFSLPSASGLVVVANGTDGILQDLVAAGNKPSDDPQAIGAGLVVVTGGLPNILLELLAACFAAGPAEAEGAT